MDGFRVGLAGLGVVTRDGRDGILSCLCRGERGISRYVICLEGFPSFLPSFAATSLFPYVSTEILEPVTKP